LRQVVNISELHRLTLLDRATLGKMLKPLTPVGEGSKNALNYYLDDCLVEIVNYIKARNEDSPKARKESADADKAEIQVAKLRGDLVPVGLVRSSAADLVKSLYQRCVNLAPRILSDKITGKTDRNEVEIAMRQHFASIFDELRSLPSNFLSVSSEDQTLDEPDTERQSESS
jgi:hypothetical protein